MTEKIYCIFGAGEYGAELRLPEDPFVTAADAGYLYLTEKGVTPDLIVGDFDSLGSVPDFPSVTVLPVKKDDTDTLFARLYLEAYEYLKFKAHIYQRMRMTENGIAYIYIDKAMQEEFSLTLEQASACVGNLDSIRGCICWMVFIENGDAEGSIRVRLRSRFVTINEIAEKYHGGGHACASGATVYSLEEMESLLRDADAHVKEYKETHEGWL